MGSTCHCRNAINIFQGDMAFCLSRGRFFTEECLEVSCHLRLTSLSQRETRRMVDGQVHNYGEMFTTIECEGKYTFLFRILMMKMRDYEMYF